MTRISPIQLLNQARDLASPSVGSPTPTDLRRSVSSAYYALYHLITQRVATRALPEVERDDALRLTRSISHQAVRDVSRWILGGKVPEHLAPLVAEAAKDRHLHVVADVFIRAQEARHQADYDNLAEFSEREVIALIDEVHDAIVAVMVRAGADQYQTFWMAILLKSQAK